MRFLDRIFRARNELEVTTPQIESAVQALQPDPSEELKARLNYLTQRLELPDKQSEDYKEANREHAVLSTYLRLSEDEKAKRRAAARPLSYPEIAMHASPSNYGRNSRFVRVKDEIIVFPYSPGLHVEFSVSVFGLALPDDAGLIRGSIRFQSADRPAVIMDGNSSSLAIGDHQTFLFDRMNTHIIARRIAESQEPMIEVYGEDK